MPPYTLTKWFHVEPCTWTLTLLDEALWLDGLDPDVRPVPIHKLPPELWIDAEGAHRGRWRLPGQPANFTLLYSATPAALRTTCHDPQHLPARGALRRL